MKTRTIGIVFLLCCGIAAAGCAKKEVVKQDEPLAQTAAPSAETTTPVQDQQAAKDTTVTDESLKDVMAFDTIYFDFDSFTLSDAARATLDKNAQSMLKRSGDKIRLEGNCDERGSDEYNLALGEKRAKAALNYLLTLGVPQDRLSVISYGEEKPADQGHDEAAWAKNRRVEFIIQK
jgi:peptidoglycan-associated lipoprotein